MTIRATASWLIEQEARALLTRLDRVRPFALTETMVPAAALSPTAQSVIERFLIQGRSDLRRQVLGFLAWLGSAGRGAPPDEQHNRFVTIRMQFNDVLAQLDLFSEVVTQRSEHNTGVWLSGLDVLAADSLSGLNVSLDPPPVVCYLARGPGAAIRRAKTRLPGGTDSPVAIIRVPRERMVGHGVASSLVHEVGHQGAALLELVPSLRSHLQQFHEGPAPAASPWRSWENWISEIIADFWSIATLGISSTLGLLAVVSLPRWAVFRPSGSDPHPVPYIRVLLSCEIGRALYPHPQWAALANVWRQLYPINIVTDSYRNTLDELAGSMPDFVAELLGHRPPALHGRSLREIVPANQCNPERLLELFGRSRAEPQLLAQTRPALALAVLGQARAAGKLSPRSESRVVGNLLTYWAARSSLDISAVCADIPRTAPVQLIS